MKKRVRSSYAWVTKNQKNISTLLSLNRPMTPSELLKAVKQDIDLSEKSNLRLSEFTKRNLLKCLNPGAYIGRVYALTEQGLRMAKRLAKEFGRKHQYSEPPADYKLYSWLIHSPRKKALLSNIRLAKLVRFKGIHADTSRSYKHYLVSMFEKKGLVKMKIENGVPLIYITEKGKAISNALSNDFSK